MTRDPSAQRDAHLRLVRRLRVGLVSVGVAGSLGVAGLVATHPSNATSGQTLPRPVSPAQVAGNGSGGDDFSGWQGDEGEDDGGRAQTQQNQPQAPALQPGFGPSNGSTGGS